MTMTLSNRNLTDIVDALDDAVAMNMKAEAPADRRRSERSAALLDRFINLDPQEGEVAVVMTPQQSAVMARILNTVFAANAFDYAAGLDGAIEAYAPGIGQADRTALLAAFEEASRG